MTTEVDRLRNRFLLCSSEVVRAKRDFAFWIKEYRAAVSALTANDQYCFDFFKEAFKDE